MGFVWRRRRSCERALRQASLRLDGELSELEAAALERHLRSCASCRAFAAELEATVSLLRAAPLSRPARTLRLELPERTRNRVARHLAAAAAVLGTLAAAGAGALVSGDMAEPPAPIGGALVFASEEVQAHYARMQELRLEPWLAALGAETPGPLARRALL